MEKFYDAIIIGAGAAGLMCAIAAGKRGRRVWLVDHASKTAEKIRISGGGRCNFTNVNTRPEAFLSDNKHFCKSALKQFTQHDFIELVESYGIDYHEKKLGQLFCDGKSVEIIDMLLEEATKAGIRFNMETNIYDISLNDDGKYRVQTSHGTEEATSLVIATGGLSIPKIGATKFGYEIAKQFGIKVIETQPALVPLTFQAALLEQCKALSGVSVDAIVSFGKISFREALLFTHRGLSGPAILQISSYWQEGKDIHINLLPDIDIYSFFLEQKTSHPKKEVQTILSEQLPKKLAISLCNAQNIEGRLADISHKNLKRLAESINVWQIKPSGTEGYRTAEVTKGGIDTNALSSKTMETKSQENLYFIGEVVDVTGHLGGYNFQWAWSSGYVAGQYI